MYESVRGAARAAGSLLKISRYAVYIVGRLVVTPGRGGAVNRRTGYLPGPQGREGAKV